MLPMKSSQLWGPGRAGAAPGRALAIGPSGRRQCASWSVPTIFFIVFVCRLAEDYVFLCARCARGPSRCCLNCGGGWLTEGELLGAMV